MQIPFISRPYVGTLHKIPIYSKSSLRKQIQGLALANGPIYSNQLRTFRVVIKTLGSKTTVLAPAFRESFLTLTYKLDFRSVPNFQ